MSGYRNMKMDEVFSYTMVVENKMEAKSWAMFLFDQDVSFAVTQDYPYKIWMSETAFQALKNRMTVVEDE